MVRKRIKLKCDAFGIGTAISGGAQAAGNVVAAGITADATKHAADMSYQGQIATNDANIRMQESANSANRDIANETNETNIRLAREQNQWNLEQWNRQNEYNSPANQMKLYRDAGLNPVLAQGDFSPAQELTSADLAVAQPSASIQAPRIENPHAKAAEIKLQGALAQSNYLKELVGNAVDVAQGFTHLKKETTDINKTKAEIENIWKQNRGLDIQNDILDKTKSANVKAAFLANKKLIADTKLVLQSCKTEKEKTKYQTLLNDMQSQNNDILKQTSQWLIKKPQAEVKSLLASAFKAYQDGAYQQFLTNYAKANNRALPSNSIDLVLSQLLPAVTGLLGGIQNIVNNPVDALLGAGKNLVGNSAKALKKHLDDAMNKLLQWSKGIFDE